MLTIEFYSMFTIVNVPQLL